MGIGYAMRKLEVLSAEADRSLIRVVVLVLYPALALDTIVGNEALARPANLIWPPILGFGSILLGIVVSRWGAQIFRVPEGKPRRAFVFTASLQKLRLHSAAPVAVALFDRGTMGVLFAFFSAWNLPSGASLCGN